MELSPESLLGLVIGGAWVLRELLPIFLKRRGGSDDRDEHEHLLSSKVYEDNEAWWHRWRDQFERDMTRRRADIDKRLDSHSEDLKELAQRVSRLERAP